MPASPIMLKKMLKDFSIRQTSSRLDILDEFVGKDHALSQPDLERSLGEQYDRVTIYRTLTLYQEKGLIHQVLDDAGVMKYALCSDHCTDADHHHDHVHFKCNDCGQTVCINDVHIPRLTLPKGYVIEEQNVLMTGTCSNCSQN